MIEDVQRAARRLREFLDDAAVQAVLAAYKDGAYKAFLAAQTDEARRNAQAEAVALDKLVGVLQGLVDEAKWKDEQETAR